MNSPLIDRLPEGEDCPQCPRCQDDATMVVKALTDTTYLFKCRNCAHVFEAEPVKNDNEPKRVNVHKTSREAI